MAKKALFSLVLVFALFFGGVGGGVDKAWADSEAPGEEDSPEDEIENPDNEESESTREKATAWGPTYDQNQMEAYSAAITQDNCATPSLECLVHQTSRFVAIEWVNNILYPGNPKLKSDGSLEEASLNTPSSISSRGSFIGGITHLMSEMYRYPAARTSVYVADVLENAHIITPAYAQGLGFASLNPVLELWKVFRNIAYMLFVFIFIIIGFMIMFRQKIGGQSAVTAQQAIPSVIASLIFVTFSYAIVGFLIDMMYLLMFMIIGVFGQTSGSVSGEIIDFNIFNLMGELNGAIGASFGPDGGFVKNIDIVQNLLGSMVNNETLGDGLGIIGGITLSLVLAVAILIGTFKLFFELLKSYATIVLSVVTAPVILLGGAFPGKNSFGPWIKNIVANLSAFPVVLMTVILFYQFTETASTSGGFVPPFLLGRGQSGAITTLMGLAIILALPEIVKDVKTKLGATEGFGGMVFNAAGAAAKKGWSGGELIPGTGIKMPGTRQIGTAATFGTKDSRDKYEKDKGNFWRKGMVGGTWERGRIAFENRRKDKASEKPIDVNLPQTSSPGPRHKSGGQGVRGGMPKIR